MSLAVKKQSQNFSFWQASNLIEVILQHVKSKKDCIIYNLLYSQLTSRFVNFVS